MSGQWRGASDEWQDKELCRHGRKIRKSSRQTHAKDMEPTTTKIKSYKDLLVWQKGLSLVKLAYKATKEFPADERFGLVSQIRRAAVPIPSNIAEAEGSLAELETQIIISTELGFVNPDNAQPLFHAIEELQKMLNSLRSKLATHH